MQMTLTKASICKLLDSMEIEECAEFIQYYISSREGLKGYCRV